MNKNNFLGAMSYDESFLKSIYTEIMLVEDEENQSVDKNFICD